VTEVTSPLFWKQVARKNVYECGKMSLKALLRSKIFPAVLSQGQWWVGSVERRPRGKSWVRWNA